MGRETDFKPNTVLIY